MYQNWITMEHYRLHIIETWPDGPKKDSSLRAVRSTLKSLGEMVPQGYIPFDCSVWGRLRQIK